MENITFLSPVEFIHTIPATGEQVLLRRCKRRGTFRKTTPVNGEYLLLHLYKILFTFTQRYDRLVEFILLYVFFPIIHHDQNGLFFPLFQ